MNVLSIEIKIPIENKDELAEKLIDLDAEFIGTDYQRDTYFEVAKGRLKLRQGSIENTLIFYNRKEEKSTKKSEVILQKLPSENSGMLELLHELFEEKIFVEKERKIFFIENVKFHLDYVEGLGDFLEIEALDTNLDFSETELSDQCNKYIELFELDRSKFVDQSYSDMILEKRITSQ